MSPETSTAIIGFSGQALNASAMASANRKSRQYADKAYERSRRDALADWAMVNEYNSPRAQMQRYQEAGLNPHLIYGQQNNSPTVRAGDTQSWKPNPVQVDTMAPVMGFYDTRMKKAQTDLIAVQQTVAQQNALLQAAKAAETSVNTAKKGFELEQAKKLQAGVLEMQQLNVEKLKQDLFLDVKKYELAVNKDTREKLMNDANVRAAAQSLIESRSRVYLQGLQGERLKKEMMNMDQQLELMVKDETLKELEVKLRKEGVNPNDPWYMRVLLQQAKKYFPELFD